MPAKFRSLCDAMNAMLTPALVAAGYAAPDEPFNRHRVRYEFKRAVPAGHETLAVLFRRDRQPEFSVQVFVEPREGLRELEARGGQLVVGTLAPARPRWPFAVRTFGLRRSVLARMQGLPEPSPSDAVQCAIDLLPEVEAWWGDQRSTAHILSVTARYPGNRVDAR
jgi:hypothetical protein